MKEFLAHLGKKRIVWAAMKPMVEKVGNNDLDASGGSPWRKRPGVIRVILMSFQPSKPTFKIVSLVITPL